MQLHVAFLVFTSLVAGCGSPGQSASVAAAQATHRPDLTSRPKLLFQECRALPEYPPGSRQRRETGTVRLAFNIDETGKVTASELRQSSGYAELDQAALNVLSRCPFLPAYKDGQAMAGETEVSYVWRLE